MGIYWSCNIVGRVSIARVTRHAGLVERVTLSGTFLFAPSTIEFFFLAFAGGRGWWSCRHRTVVRLWVLVGWVKTLPRPWAFDQRSLHLSRDRRYSFGGNQPYILSERMLAVYPLAMASSL